MSQSVVHVPGLPDDVEVRRSTRRRRSVTAYREGGRTIVPLSLYFKNGYAKVEIALAVGKKNYDKRQTIAERDAKRETQRAMGRRLKGRTD